MRRNQEMHRILPPSRSAKSRTPSRRRGRKETCCLWRIGEMPILHKVCQLLAGLTPKGQGYQTFQIRIGAPGPTRAGDLGIRSQS